MTASVLRRAAGVEIDAELALDGLDPDASAVLVSAIREATTNILHHSATRHCTTRCTARADGRAQLEVVNGQRPHRLLAARASQLSLTAWPPMAECSKPTRWPTDAPA